MHIMNWGYNMSPFSTFIISNTCGLVKVSQCPVTGSIFEKLRGDIDPSHTLNFVYVGKRLAVVSSKKHNHKIVHQTANQVGAV